MRRKGEGMRAHVQRQDDSGQGIAYVLIVSAALLVFVIAMVDLLWSESRMLNRERRSRELFHDADAAVDRATYALLKSGNWDALPQGAVPGFLGDATFDDIPGVRYRVKIQEGNWTPYDPATDIEATYTPAGDVEADRTITVWTSRTHTGERRKVQVVLTKSTLNSALFSGGQIYVEGKSQIWWGPVVSYATISNAIPLTTLGDHPLYLCKGGITVGGVGVTTLGMDSANPLAGVSADEYSQVLTEMPPVPLDQYKLQALTDAGSDPLFYVTGDPSPTFALPKGTTVDTVVFFDTEDGLPWDGDTNSAVGNGVEVKKTANWCGSGKLIIMGDLDVKGTGSCKIDLIPPPDCYPRFDFTKSHCNPVNENNMFWDGYIHIANKLSGAGNVRVYGSVSVRDTAGLTGSLDIWYKSNNDSLGTLGKTVSVKLWFPRRPFTNINPSSGYVEAFPD